MGEEQGNVRSALILPEQSGRQGDDNRFLWALENPGSADLQIVADGLHGTELVAGSVLISLEGWRDVFY